MFVWYDALGKMILFWYSNVVTFGDIYSPRQGRGVKTIHSCSNDGGSSEFRGGRGAIIDEFNLIKQILPLILLKSEGVPPPRPVPPVLDKSRSI